MTQPQPNQGDTPAASPLAVIGLRFAVLELHPWGARTVWPDGTACPATPHDLPHYHYLAYRCGYDGSTLRYCQDHELAHHVVGEAFGRRSEVLWLLAHGSEPSAEVAASEEALALALQRYARAGEPPLIDRVDWPVLRRRLLTLSEGRP